MRRALIVSCLAALAAFLLPAQAQAAEKDSSFILSCDLSHRLADDPIVFPGQPGASHEHDFFGNTTTNAFSTYASMRAGGTTCGLSADNAGYWTPTARDEFGNPVGVLDFRVYYSPRPFLYRTTVPFPADFQMVAKAPGAPRMYWNCQSDDDSVKLDYIPECPAGVGLRLNAVTPNCWNGWQLDSSDHVSHVVYPKTNSSSGDSTSCPASHPVKVPQLRLRVRYAPVENSALVTLSSGEVVPHNDFKNTWDQGVLESLVRTCLNPSVKTECGVLRD